MVLDGALSAGSLIVFIFYLGKMYKPMQDLSKMTDAYSKAAVGYERIREVLETDRRSEGSARRAGELPTSRARSNSTMSTFSYTPDSPILKDVSFKIEPGQVAALVGPTGAGKTTIISLIPRFYDPTSGAVKIDGTDIRQFTAEIAAPADQLRPAGDRAVSRARSGTTSPTESRRRSRGEIFRAAELANAHEFIEKMPEGYDTMVGERGVTLSGGQRQRIAIARAIIRNTPILILDEPSSGLDAGVRKTGFRSAGPPDGRQDHHRDCAPAFHHRRANIIYVVKDGAIVEHGTHEELLKAGGLYAGLYELQFQRDEEMEALSAKS